MHALCVMGTAGPGRAMRQTRGAPLPPLMHHAATPVSTQAFRSENGRLGPMAWTHWAVSCSLAVLGVVAHVLRRDSLLTAHWLGGGVLSAALAAWDTAFWFAITADCSGLVPLFSAATCDVITFPALNTVFAFMVR